MKQRAIYFASRLMVVALAVCVSLSFAACGDDDEPSVDELLSDKTSTVRFELPATYVNYLLYDYAGSHLLNCYVICSSKKNYELELRQGKHHFIWIDCMSYPDREDLFDPIAKTFNVIEPENIYRYAEYDYEVTDYVKESHKPNFYPLYATVEIYVTDFSSDLKQPDEPVYFVSQQKEINVGKIVGFPVVTSFSLHGGKYEATDHFNGTVTAFYGVYSKKVRVYCGTRILCPEDGINGIQLHAEVESATGETIPTTPLPPISLRRGYTTILKGPLFSGSTADWKVTMEAN